MDTDKSKQSSFESNTVSLLKRELKKVVIIQLEKIHAHFQDKLNNSQQRIERLRANLQQTQQHVDFFSQETQKASEGIKDTNWLLTKELCSELSRLKSPPAVLLELGDKCLLILGLKERSWRAFRAAMKNYGSLKALMNRIQPENLTETQLNELLTVWKNQSTLQPQLQQISRGAAIISEWISYCVKYKYMQETLHASKRKIPEIESKIQLTLSDIASKSNELQLTRKKIEEIRSILSSVPKDRSRSDEYLKSLDVLSISSIATSISKFEHLESYSRQYFPNFELGTESLYGETFVSKGPAEDEFQISIEGKSEGIGCCRSRFFCL
jgi:predicted  nucleic acid-binding Zn-ribbon protein